MPKIIPCLILITMLITACNPWSEAEITFTVLVMDSQTNAPIANANVIPVSAKGADPKTTDGTGTATFTIESQSEIRLVVQADQYQTVNDRYKLTQDKRIDVVMVRGQGNVTVQIVDDETNDPVAGVTVILLVNGHTYNQSTDSSGLARFPLTFAADSQEVRLSLQNRGYETEYHNLTLYRDSVNSFRLNSKTGQLVSTHTPSPAESSVSPTDTPNSIVTLLPPPTNTPVPLTATPRPMNTPVPPTNTPMPQPAIPANMVRVPAGEFTMGSEDGESDEKPVHTVYVDEFYIDQYEVTNEQYAEFLNAEGNQEEGGATWLDIGDSDVLIEERSGQYQAKGGYGDHPVIEVSWYGARAYCEWAGKRLPTEAEWEKAARGTDGREYPWGNEEPSCDRANYGGCVGDTTAVGSYEAGKSPYGAYDMAGNVWEWTLSAREAYPYNKYDGRNDLNKNVSRVLRGGSWNDNASSVRTADRYWNYPTYAYLNFGFRCLRSP